MGQLPFEQRISVIVLCTFWYGLYEECIFPSFNVFIYDPGLDGVETKSQQSKSKSSWTSSSPSAFSFNEPIPLDETPNLILLSSNAFNIFPDGVGNIF